MMNLWSVTIANATMGIMMTVSITHLAITHTLSLLPLASIAGVWTLRMPVASDIFCNMVVNNTNAVSDAT